MRLILIFTLLLAMACSNRKKPNKTQISIQNTEDLIAVLDTIWRTEQEPITLRDSLIEKYGVESKEVQGQQEIYERNHAINERYRHNSDKEK